MKILFDGDMLVYRMCSACEERCPFDKSVISKADPEETWNVIQLRVEQCVRIVEDYFNEEVDFLICFSSRTNFRKKLNPTYKANRKNTPKPILYHDMYLKCYRIFPCIEWENLEADDVMGLLQNDDTIICSGDKDMRQIPGYHLSLSDPEIGVESVTKAEGDFLFMVQCLSGDSTDNYFGCPQIGATKAKKILEEAPHKWRAIVDTYESAMSPKSMTKYTEGGVKRVVKLRSTNLGLGAKDALLNARMAYILRNEDDYNQETHEVKLWSP